MNNEITYTGRPTRTTPNCGIDPLVEIATIQGQPRGFLEPIADDQGSAASPRLCAHLRGCMGAYGAGSGSGTVGSRYRVQ
jgi:hypothetical protein